MLSNLGFDRYGHTDITDIEQTDTNTPLQNLYQTDTDICFKYLKQSKIKDSISAKKAEKWLESEYFPEGWFYKEHNKSNAVCVSNSAVYTIVCVGVLYFLALPLCCFVTQIVKFCDFYWPALFVMAFDYHPVVFAA